MNKIKVSVPGKVILAGEHGVVYGKTALVTTIGLRVKVRVREIEKRRLVIKDKCKDLSLIKKAVEFCKGEVGGFKSGWEITVESDLPIGSGLGSSAAIATAIVWGLLKDSSEEVKDRVVKKIEDWQHGKSSGVDQAVVKEGGMIRYMKGKGIEKMKAKDLPEFLLIDSGKPIESTGEMVTAVAINYTKFETIFERMGEISENWKVELIKENEGLLEEIGVVGERAKEMIKQIEEINGMAKICGAGGVKKGSGILLGYHKNINLLEKLAEKKKWKIYQTQLGVEGVKYE